MFDGVDEIPLTEGDPGREHEPRSMFLSGLAAAIPVWIKQGNRLLVTSRPYGLSPQQIDGLGLVAAPVQELGTELQQLLVFRWFHCLADRGDDGGRMGQELLSAVALREDLRPLSSNPMLLTAMCVVYRQGPGGLPHDRFDVYDRIVENVLRNKFPDNPAEIAPVRNWLTVVAEGMHTGAGLATRPEVPLAQITFADVDRLIELYQQPRRFIEPIYKGPADAREQLLSRSGLLLPRGDQTAAFYHLTIQDFLAAQRLFEQHERDLSAVFRERSGRPEWRGTLAFLFGWQLWRQSGDPARGIELVSGLIDSLEPQQIGLGVVLGECLQILLTRGCRPVESVERRYQQFCIDALENCADPIRDRCQLGLALGALGDPRIVVDLRPAAQRERAFVLIPAGTYTVGDDALRKEGEAIPKTQKYPLQTSFLLSKYPVTNSQFRVFVDDDGYSRHECWSDEGWSWLQDQEITRPEFWNDPQWNSPNKPVVGVSWYEADAFARWAGGRLPTEWEWEAAARGRAGSDYPWGREWQDGICNSSESGLDTTSPVGLFVASRGKEFELHDMAGNVWEWCASVWVESDDGKLPAAAEGKKGSHRVIRGGGWSGTGSDCRPAFRSGVPPVFRADDVGFRLLLSPSGEVAERPASREAEPGAKARTERR